MIFSVPPVPDKSSTLQLRKATSTSPPLMVSAPLAERPDSGSSVPALTVVRVHFAGTNPIWHFGGVERRRQAANGGSPKNPNADRKGSCDLPPLRGRRAFHAAEVSNIDRSFQTDLTYTSATGRTAFERNVSLTCLPGLALVLRWWFLHAEHKVKRHNSEEVFTMLRLADNMSENGELQKDTCKSLGISVMTLHRWRKLGTSANVLANGGVPSARIDELLLDENRRLRRIVSDLSLEKLIMEELLEGVSR
jgi:hypothetical protein